MAWQEYRGDLPHQLVGLGDTPQLAEGAWWVRQGLGSDGSRVLVYPTVRVGMGDLADPSLQSAAGALMDDLNSNGCQAGFDPVVKTFQQAFVDAGGSLPPDTGGGSGIDGLYGANTQAALQATLNAGPNQPPQAAPAGCVPAGSGGSGGGGTVILPGGSTYTSTSTIMGLPAWAFWTLAAVVGGGAVLIAWSVLSKGGKAHSVHHVAKHHAHHARQLRASESRRKRRGRKGRKSRRHSRRR
jgi:hypothetical protein